MAAKHGHSGSETVGLKLINCSIPQFRVRCSSDISHGVFDACAQADPLRTLSDVPSKYTSTFAYFFRFVYPSVICID
ncbi:unnamed protein product [Soboliphyme baturini]|uniref:Uncharacterized protein n=1 Tax=Soboliphyme baturini TaxID=241478 RepID=A0A183IIA0_9BILA|nr:unnamed protein product [Soboliphyme baturini]